MREIQILFSTPMVQAILRGDKTQTRRVVKPQPEKVPGSDDSIPAREFIEKGNELLSKGLKTIIRGTGGMMFPDCPYGKPGDVLWVRETWCQVMRDHAHDLLEGRRENDLFVRPTQVHSDWMQYAKDKYGYKWKPSIHMPKAAARIWLKVVNVRVERLHEITEQDAISEGVEKCIADKERFGARAVGMRLFRNYERKDNSLRDYPCNGFEEAKISFETLWQSINGRESWDANPWVWVVEFEVLSTTGRPCSI